MKTLQKLSLAALGLFAFNAAIAQNCREEHTYCDQTKDKSWQMSNQSKSGSFAQGEEHELSLVIYDGMDYRISFCANDEQVNGQIEFELYTMKKVKKYDSKKKRMSYVPEKKTIYNNRTDELSQEIELQADGTKKIYIAVHVPEGASEGKRKKMAASNVVCVGVLVQQQKGTETGFK